MARDQTRRPVTKAELDGLREELRDQRGEIREALAEQGVDVSSWSVPGGDDADEQASSDSR